MKEEKKGEIFEGNLSCDCHDVFAIMDGLDIAWQRGVNQLLVENKGDRRESSTNIRELLARDWHVKVMFTPRRANMTVDSMAEVGRNVPLDLRIYDILPKMIEMEILQYSVGVRYNSCYS
ncbi:hypothetical protein ES288_D12G153500v1 [Gossypium darwinii]|uniref:RNase H type-1 domain-containing protein n=1 Tax=Gossypium darwinii TaxID=34276 RepID=A0A5D2A8G9_GOSDA|nr:hypothetical protein ES288_D12G153500v1 [Gossypium darwinii]